MSIPESEKPADVLNCIEHVLSGLEQTPEVKLLRFDVARAGYLLAVGHDVSELTRSIREKIDSLVLDLGERETERPK